MNALEALLLIVAANAGAWAAGKALGPRLAAPMDFGLVLPDGERLLGTHKTWRGLIAGALSAAVAALLLGLDVWVGLVFGGLALLGDALSSCLKRRLRWPPGKEVPLIDQLPEALLPLIVLSGPLDLDAAAIAISTGLFVLLDMASVRFRKSAPSHS